MIPSSNKMSLPTLMEMFIKRFNIPIITLSFLLLSSCDYSSVKSAFASYGGPKTIKNFKDCSKSVFYNKTDESEIGSSYFSEMFNNEPYFSLRVFTLYDS